AILGFIKFQQISAAMKAGASFQMPPEAVTTVIAQPGKWESSIQAVGSIEPIQGVTLSADQPGVVSRISFTSGSRVRAGQVLVALDTKQERAQLAAAEARRDLAQQSLTRGQSLLKDG